jgi:hypothetical protein
MNSYKQGGPNFDKDRSHFSDRDNGRHLYNRADRDHDFDRNHQEGGRNFDHRGIVRGNFFERAPFRVPPLLARRLGIPD